VLASAGAMLWLHEAHIERVVAREELALDAAHPVTEDSRRVERAIDDLHALVLSPSFERVLESEARLESTPSLLWGRRRTNLLCARAVVDARDGRSEEAARRLA